MKLFGPSIPTALATLLWIVTASQNAAFGDEPQLLQAGFAEADITPDSGMEQPGGYGKSYHQQVHDPCKIRASVFADGNSRVAIVGLDGIGVHGEMVHEARHQIHSRCGIAPEAIMVAASHSHSSGPIHGIMPGDYNHASPQVQKLAYEHSTCTNLDYYRDVLNKLVDAVCRADAAKQPCRCGAGKGVEDKVAFNRRFLMKNGLTYTHPGQGNPDIVKPAGPVDPEVGVIGAWNSDGQLTGCIVNFACHATTSPGGISANYIYYLETAIRGMFGQQVVVVFLPGTSGDVTQVDNLSPYQRPDREQWARLVGGRVGAEAVKVLLSMAPGEMGPLDASTASFEVERRAPSPERLQRAEELVRQDPRQVGGTEWTFAKEIVLLDALLEREPRVAVEVQAVQVGPVVMLGLPAEVFCQFGLDMKSASPFPLTFPVTFANDCVGYIPTEDAFGEHGGGYETRLTAYTNLDITAGRQMVKAAVELAKNMTPGKIPVPPPHPPYSAPWSYGSVAPQIH
jgi:hypothetical protein